MRPRMITANGWLLSRYRNQPAQPPPLPPWPGQTSTDGGGADPAPSNQSGVQMPPQAQAEQRHKARAPKLSLVTSPSLASRPRSEVPPSTTTSPPVKPLISTDPNAQRPESHAQLQLSTSPTLTATVTRNVNASFLDDPTPIEPAMADQHASRGRVRDSHDLSLSPRNVTRDSLVNNMLLSLDQFSLGHTTSSSTTRSFTGKALTYDDPRPWAHDSITGSFSHGFRPSVSSPSSSSFRHPQPSRHHYSYSSDYDDDSTRTSVQLPRARSRSPNRRRSNSSSTFQASFPKPPAAADSPIQRARPRANTGSSTSSVSYDAGYPQNIAGPASWDRTGFRRSASFDLGPLQAQTQLNAPLVSPFHIDFLTNPSDLDLDPVDGASGHTRRPANHQLVAPAMGLSDFDAAPAPSVSYGKSKTEQLAASQSAGGLGQPKERPGFFRRVFGSSKTTTTPAPAETLTSRLAGPLTNVAAPAPKDITPQPQQTQPVLQKKSSSFFRRRKKSVADDAPPLPADVPPVPSLADANGSLYLDSDRTTDSPAGSLRQIMTPFLKDGAAHSHSQPLGDITNKAALRAAEDDDDDYRPDVQREFSPDYELSPNAKIRVVHNSDSDQDQPAYDKSGRAPNKIVHRNNSFLDLDGGSDNDEPPLRQRADKENDGRLASPTAHKSRDSAGTLRGKKSPHITDQERFGDEPPRPNMGPPINERRTTSYASASTDDGDYKTAPSAAPSVRVERSSESSARGPGTLDMLKNRDLDEPEFVIGEPTEDERQKAQQIFDGCEDFIPKEKAASWMGEEGPIRQRTLQAYIELYDFTDLSILNALRKVCGRLILRGETQQVDRILVAFSKRWCDCNPNHGFKATGQLHPLPSSPTRAKGFSISNSV